MNQGRQKQKRKSIKVQYRTRTDQIRNDSAWHFFQSVLLEAVRFDAATLHSSPVELIVRDVQNLDEHSRPIIDFQDLDIMIENKNMRVNR